MTFTEFIGSILASPEFSAFILATVVGLAGWVAKSLRALIGEKLTGEQLKTLLLIGENAVKVAEQTGFTATGAEKKAIALKVAQSYLDAYGIKVTAAQLEGAIEAAVYSELSAWKPTEPDESIVVTGEAAD